MSLVDKLMLHGMKFAAGAIAQKAADGMEATLYGPHEGAAPKANYALAHHYRQTGRQQMAIEDIKKTLVNHPEDIEGLLLLGSIYAEDLNNFKEAEKIVQKILNSPTVLPSLKECARLKFEDWQQKRNPNAKIKVLAVPPPTPTLERKQTIDYQLAREHRQAGRYKEAIQCVNQVLRKKPEDFEGLLLLATIYAEDLDQMHLAEAAIKRILDSDDMRTGYKEYATSQLEAWQGPPVNSASHASPAVVQIEAEPPAPVNELETAKEHHAKGRYGSAVEILQNMLNRDRNDLEALIHLALVYVDGMKDVPKAERWFEEILDTEKLAANHYQPLMQLAAAYAKHTDTVRKADRLVRKACESPLLSEQEKQLARLQVAEWKKKWGL